MEGLIAHFNAIVYPLMYGVLVRYMNHKTKKVNKRRINKKGQIKNYTVKKSTKNPKYWFCRWKQNIFFF